MAVPGGETCYHSGVMDNTGKRGIAIVLSMAAQAALLAWVSISPRPANTCLEGSTANLTVVAVCATPLDAEEEIHLVFL